MYPKNTYTGAHNPDVYEVDQELGGGEQTTKKEKIGKSLGVFPGGSMVLPGSN